MLTGEPLKKVVGRLKGVGGGQAQVEEKKLTFRKGKGLKRRSKSHVENKAEPDSHVCTSLKAAWEILDKALSGEWPEDEALLNAILLKARECEDKLAEITVRAKELLARVEEPEAVPSAHD
jgi:hypothetical protein